MEHRWSVRKPFRSTVTLVLPPWGRVQAEISDISLGGLAITSPHHAVPVNTMTILSFSLERDGRTSYHRLPAQVAHCDDTRIGFLFTEPGSETLHVLRDMLYPPAIKLSDAIAGQSVAA